MNAHMMPAKIDIVEFDRNGDVVYAVSARDLAERLEVKKDFSTWIKAQLSRAMLAEGEDFQVIETSPLPQKGEFTESVGGRGRKTEYYLTLDAAKHVAMMAGTEKGHEIRRYFIEAEKELRRQPAPAATASFTIPQTFAEALLLAATLEESRVKAEQEAKLLAQKVEAAEAKIEEQAPDVAALERIAKSDGSLCITDAAKTLQIRPKDLFRFLRAHGWIYSRPGSGADVAYQAKIAIGVLEHKTTTIERPDGTERTVTQVRVTPKGLSRLAKEFPPPRLLN